MSNGNVMRAGGKEPIRTLWDKSKVVRPHSVELRVGVRERLGKGGEMELESNSNIVCRTLHLPLEEWCPEAA